MSVRPAISRSFSALGRVEESGTLPETGVMASILSSGERTARKMAMASSIPGSVSIMMRCEVADWGGVDPRAALGRAPASRAPAEQPRNFRRVERKESGIRLLMDQEKSIVQEKSSTASDCTGKAWRREIRAAKVAAEKFREASLLLR